MPLHYWRMRITELYDPSDQILKVPSPGSSFPPLSANSSFHIWPSASCRNQDYNIPENGVKLFIFTLAIQYLISTQRFCSSDCWDNRSQSFEAALGSTWNIFTQSFKGSLPIFGLDSTMSKRRQIKLSKNTHGPPHVHRWYWTKTKQWFADHCGSCYI